MDKLLNVKWISAIYGEKYEWTTRVFRFLLQQCALSAVFAGIFFGINGKMLYTCFCAIGLIASFVLFYLTYKMQDLKNVYLVCLFLINAVFLPAVYVLSGGYEGLAPVWMTLFIALIFIFLSGWRLYFVLVGALWVDSAVFLINLLMPDFIRELELDISNRILSLGGSVLFIGSILGIIVKYQIDKLAGERRLAEERGREIEAISDSKSLFFANMSHEIRTPINTIIGLNEMILREDVSDEIAENAINIQNASKILLAVINDILDMSKMESGKMEIVPTQYETASMFSDLVNIVWVRANQKKLDFRIDIAEDIPSMLYGDEVRIKQVLTNVLTNAVKYTEKGSVTLTVTGEKLGDNQIRLKIAVEDTGIGIKKENIDDLFTVFKRVDQQKTKTIEGTGLGLALSKQLVDMMGGSIKVDSIYQKGSCFTIILDQQIVDPRPLGAFEYAARRSVKDREKYDRSFEAPNARILVVDDNEMNLMVAKKLLRDTKVQVDLASSGKEALAKTKENSYHVILMDHLMPEMDGEETLRTLRNRQEGYCQKTPVIALTANVMTDAAKQYQEKGFDGYLAKPISGSLLEATLLNFLPEELIEAGARGMDGGQEPTYAAMYFHKKKRKVAVCAECVCDLPQEWIDEYNIKLMYYYISTEEGRFSDTREIGSNEILEYLKSGRAALTDAATLQEYETFFADNLADAEQVILITVAASTNNAGHLVALQAARNFDNVTVFNSDNLSSGMGILVLKAAQMAIDGAEVNEIIGTLTKLKERVSTSFILDTVDSMYQNHQIDKSLWRVAKLMQMHPILRLSKGKIVVGGAAFGTWEAAAKAYIRGCLRHARKIDKRILFVTYAGLNLKQLEMIRKEGSSHAEFEVVKFQKASATISGNCGVGTFGLLYVRK